MGLKVSTLNPKVGAFQNLLRRNIRPAYGVQCVVCGVWCVCVNLRGQTRRKSSARCSASERDRGGERERGGEGERLVKRVGEQRVWCVCVCVDLIGRIRTLNPQPESGCLSKVDPEPESGCLSKVWRWNIRPSDQKQLYSSLLLLS